MMFGAGKGDAPGGQQPAGLLSRSGSGSRRLSPVGGLARARTYAREVTVRAPLTRGSVADVKAPIGETPIGAPSRARARDGMKRTSHPSPSNERPRRDPDAGGGRGVDLVSGSI